MHDLIDRQAAIDGILAFMPVELGKDASMAEQVDYSAWRTAISCAESYVRTMPPAQPEDKCGECDAWNQYKNYPRQRWIPVKFRPMDSEEREYWEDQFGEELEDEDAVMFDCPMPEDGQESLVSYRKWISVDRCELDCGCYGLEGNGDWEDVIAWMPLPEPYIERRTE